ncbi:MAG: hypothetical protein R3A51_02320 [Nannocystaceae bacterium]|nr:hypothetical protein [Myxococcales bacterium]
MRGGSCDHLGARAWGLASLLACVACGQGTPASAPGCDDVEPELCAIEDASCRARVFAAVLCAREVEAAQPPARLLSWDDYAAAHEPAPPDAEALAVAAQVERAYQAIGLRPAGEDAPLAPGGPQFVATYDGDAGEILIIEDALGDDPVFNLYTLAQLYVYALQDRERDLAADWDEHAASFDGALTWRGQLAGDALLHANLVIDRLTGEDYDAADYRAYLEAGVMKAVEAAADRAVPIEQSAAQFRARFGHYHAWTLWSEGGSETVLAGLDDPLDRSAELMTATREQDPGAPALAAPLPAPVPGYAYAVDDVDGAWVLYALLMRSRAGVDHVTAWGLARRALEDRLVIAVDASAEGYALAWSARWRDDADGRADADEFAWIADEVTDEPAAAAWSDGSRASLLVVSDPALWDEWRGRLPP